MLAIEGLLIMNAESCFNFLEIHEERLIFSLSLFINCITETLIKWQNLVKHNRRIIFSVFGDVWATQQRRVTVGTGDVEKSAESFEIDGDIQLLHFRYNSKKSTVIVLTARHHVYGGDGGLNHGPTMSIPAWRVWSLAGKWPRLTNFVCRRLVFINRFIRATRGWIVRPVRCEKLYGAVMRLDKNFHTLTHTHAGWTIVVVEQEVKSRTHLEKAVSTSLCTFRVFLTIRTNGCVCVCVCARFFISTVHRLQDFKNKINTSPPPTLAW